MSATLLSLSIVPNKAIQKQPYKIPYHNPSFPIVKYNQIICDYFYWKQVQSAEEVAKMNGSLLVPSSCLTWKRKKAFSERLVPIGNKTFYMMKPTELTRLEKEKLEKHIGEIKELYH